MKVAQLVMALQHRGAEIFAAQLSRELVKNGVEVRYMPLYDYGQKKYLPEGVVLHELRGQKTGFLNFSLLLKLKNTLRDFDPDVVQANAGDTLKYAVLTKLLFGLRYKIVFRNASLVSQYLRSPIQKRFNAFLYKNVDGIASVSEQSAADFIKTFPFCSDKTTVIANGIEDRPATKTDFFGESQFNIVHVGGFTFEKNHKGLVRIFERIHRQLPDAKLWLIGDGPRRAEIENLVQKSGLQDSIIFLGSREGAVNYIAAADLLLLPSIIEGMPAVVIEALFCKIPVVAYNIGGIGEVVEDGQSGFLISLNDEAAFAEKTVALARDGAMRKAFGEKGFEKVKRQFLIPKIAQDFFRLYQKITSEK